MCIRDSSRRVHPGPSGNRSEIASDGVGEDSAAEIIASDGQILAYTNSDKGSVDFVNISDPSNPTAVTSVDVGGEPTSVAIRDGYAVAAVNTSSSFTNPSGKVVVIDMWDYKVVKEIALAGQPDAVSISPNGKFAAIAIENENDNKKLALQLKISQQEPHIG